MYYPPNLSCIVSNKLNMHFKVMKYYGSYIVQMFANVSPCKQDLVRWLCVILQEPISKAAALLLRHPGFCSV